MRTSFRPCNSLRLVLTLERATCSTSAMRSACSGTVDRNSRAWTCATVRLTPQREPISPQCMTKRRWIGLSASPIASVAGTAMRLVPVGGLRAWCRRRIFLSRQKCLTGREQTMRVLVLGGAGFIGRHAVAALQAQGHAVAIGSRDPRRAARRLDGPAEACEWRQLRFEALA